MALQAEIIPDEQASAIREANRLYNEDKLPEAGALVEDLLLKDPNDAQALTLLAAILKRAKRYGNAYQIAKRSTEERPDRPETWLSLGHCAQQLWRLQEARSCYRKALQRAQTKEQRALYLNNLGSTHIDAGEFKDAEPYVRQALEIDANDGMARHNLGLCLLARREWREAWPYYSASIGTKSRLVTKYMPAPGEPVWDGTPGKTVVIYGEQGLGDEICAASMLPDAIRDCRKVIVDCDKRLEGLFRRSFPQATVHGTRWSKQLDWPAEDREIDASIAGFEIGKFYRNDAASFTGEPYLKADPDRTLMWRSLFASKNKPAIGIAWSGGTWDNAGQFRRLPLADWQPIFDVLDATWVSLQYKDASDDIAGTPVAQYPQATLTKDYDDTAALVAACDLVIGMQTSVCHLAGALGKPVWTLIPTTSQWRYGESGTDVPWYRSMRLYRQRDDWKPTVRKVAEDLRAYFR